MTEPPKKPDFIADAKKLARWAAAFGALLAVVCHSLPPTWQAPCALLSQICKGGF